MKPMFAKSSVSISSGFSSFSDQASRGSFSAVTPTDELIRHIMSLVSSWGAEVTFRPLRGGGLALSLSARVLCKRGSGNRWVRQTKTIRWNRVTIAALGLGPTPGDHVHGELAQMARALGLSCCDDVDYEVGK